MHAVLSQRITQLISDADSISPAALKAALFDLAKHCQVVPGNDFLLGTLCGHLEWAAKTAFGRLALLLVMTEPRRRQVYFAVLARLEADGVLQASSYNEAARADLLSRLITGRNADIISNVYGSCPPGFLRLISNFGECAQQKELYISLFELLKVHPDLAQPLLATSQGEPLPVDIVKMMLKLPATALGVRVAARFGTRRAYNQFMEPYKNITGFERLSETHMLRIADGEAPGKLLKGLYLALPFPTPVLSAPGLIHIPDGLALVRAAQRYSNCFADHLGAALNGARQFYIWRQSGEPDVMFAIDSEAPFSWYLSEHRLADNEMLPRYLRKALFDLVAGYRIRTSRSIESLMELYVKDLEELNLFDNIFDYLDLVD